MALPVQTLSKYACFIDIWPPEPSSATLSQGRGRGRGSPPRRFLTGPRVLPGPVEALQPTIPIRLPIISYSALDKKTCPGLREFN